MKIDINKTYRTRSSNRPVRIYCVDAGGVYPVHGSVLVDGVWEFRSWTADGYLISDNNTFETPDIIEDISGEKKTNEKFRAFLNKIMFGQA